MSLPVQITAEQRTLIGELAGYGLTWDQIASVLKLNKRTLQRHCQEDYDNGKNVAIGMPLHTCSPASTSSALPRRLGG